MGSKNHQKSYILHSGHPEDPFWLFGVTPMLRKHLSILGQNDPGLREIFLEFNCGHVGKKIESLQLSCQKLTFDHIWA